MKKIYTLLFISIIGFQLKAQVINWDFNGNTGSELYVPATGSDPNTTASQISRGIVIASAMANTYSGTNWTQTNLLADAISNNSYYQFSVQANSGFLLSFSELDANFRRSATGPRSFQWRFSLDGTNFINAGSQVTYTGTENDGAIQPSINLNAIPQLQDINSGVTVTFRLYGFNAVNAAGSFGFGRLNGDDLSLFGKVYPSGILAIKLINFTAANNSNITRLHWLVDCTSTSVKFEMQRAGSDHHYNTVYSNTETQARCAQPFDIKDESTPEGINFYRLKMTDIDGRVSYSNTLQVVNKKSGNSEIKVFPTVVSNNATISIPADKDYAADILIIDNQGRQLHKIEAQLYKGTNNIPLNTTDLPRGKYYIKVVSGERKNNTAVMIKQ